MMLSSSLRALPRTLTRVRGVLQQHPAAAAVSFGTARTSMAVRAMPLSATATATATTTETASPDAQKAHWNSYLASGRGSVALFGSIDRDKDGKLSVNDIRQFLSIVDQFEHAGVNRKAFAVLDHRAEDHALTLREFQEWLVLATQHENAKCIHPVYHASPVVGNKSEAKPVEHDHAWNASTMSQAVRRMQYAVRGEVVIKADEMAAAGRTMVYTNIGNPHSVGQKPITYYRQVLALCDLPAHVGVDHPNVTNLFPADVIAKAKELRDIVGPSGTGAYTNSQGLAGVRKHIADFIANRDGHPAYDGDIFLTNGASSGIEMVLNGLISHDTDAIMIPIPQYPIYSALITRLGGRKIGYELDEDLGWAVTTEELEQRLAEAQAKGLHVKALAMINPGNPTGQVMERRDVENVARFCASNGIVMLSDEVYQKNIYAEGKKFVSAKKVAVETPGCEHLELVSFHSTSKGLIGECGRRGGYMEFHGIDKYVQSQLYKMASAALCPGVAGQLMTSLMVKGPQPGDESYDLFVQEEQGIYESLKRRALSLVKALNEIEGISCQPAEGAMYAFPRLYLPQKAYGEAERRDVTPDTLYALSLLEETGIVVVPASGFGQKVGRVGFRTTFLPPEDQLAKAIQDMAAHHKRFCEKYS